ncbi:MAG: hypothetical protein GQ534_03155 [Candidatus Delongbacteria bacterium]|nr:hypothetical protein [Candidatus Delongbacteria bacterium]
MDYKTLILGLSSVFVGWLLAQFTGILKDFYYTRKIKKCLLEELYELKSELERTQLIYTRQLQIYALQGIEGGTPVPLSNHIFKNYYKDAVLGLNKQQRLSYQLIHTLVENVNIGMIRHRELTIKLLEKNIIKGSESITEKEGDSWGKNVICEYQNVAAMIWHIKYHLNNHKYPELLPFSEEHKNYLQYLENVDNEVSSIIEKAKKLDKGKFQKIYNPDAFIEKIT